MHLRGTIPDDASLISHSLPHLRMRHHLTQTDAAFMKMLKKKMAEVF